jgi:hypothetical protein
VIYVCRLYVMRHLTRNLLELIYNQDRGNLNYPNERFIKLVEFLVQIIQKILQYLPHKKVDYILTKF